MSKKNCYWVNYKWVIIQKVKDGDKVKSNKLMSFRIDDEKLLQKYKAIWTNIEDLKKY